MRLYFEEETPVVEVDEPVGETTSENEAGDASEVLEPTVPEDEAEVLEGDVADVLEPSVLPEGETEVPQLPSVSVPGEVQEPERIPLLDSGDASIPSDDVEVPSTSVGVDSRPFLTTPVEDFTVTEGLLLCILFFLVLSTTFWFIKEVC